MLKIKYIVFICLGLSLGAQPYFENAQNRNGNNQNREPSMGVLEVNDLPVPSYNPRVNSRSNEAWISLIDSSSNGWGMYTSTTKPLYVDYEQDHWFFVYRQYAGEGTTHGQLGAALGYLGDNENFQRYYNLNANGNPPWGGGGVGGNTTAQARYPSALGNEDYPYAIWNEFTAQGIGNGGRPYYTFDEFGWDGGAFAYPMDIDLLWDDNPDSGKDLWVGCPSIYSSEQNISEQNMIISYTDWSRAQDYLFESAYQEDGYFVFGSETLIFEYACNHPYGTGCSPFNLEDQNEYWTPPPMTSIGAQSNRAAIGKPALFLDGSQGGSEIMNTQTFVIKLKEDPDSDWGELHYIPANIFNNIRSEYFPNYSSYAIGEKYDFKLDSNGDIHILMQIFPAGEDSYGYVNGSFCDWEYQDNLGMNIPVDNGAGWYHFTISFTDLEDNGDNWEYSRVVTGAHTWCYQDQSGNSQIWGNLAGLAFDRWDTSIVYVVTNLGVPGEGYEHFDAWSEDIFTFKSEDNGQSWWNPLNVSNTPSYPGDPYPIHEGFPHVYQWVDNDMIHFVYQRPNWNWNESGDFVDEGFMNYVYKASATFMDNDQPTYGEGASCSYQNGDINLDSVVDILDIITYVNVILVFDFDSLDDVCQYEVADFNNDGSIDIFDIISTINAILDA